MLSGIIVPLYAAIAVGLILLYLRLYVRHRRARTSGSSATLPHVTNASSNDAATRSWSSPVRRLVPAETRRKFRPPPASTSLDGPLL